MVTTRSWCAIAALAGLLAGLVSAAPAATVPGLGTAASPAAGAQRIVAVGDIHGDLDAFAGILREAGLVDAELQWSGGAATLVQTGDFTDRGPDVRAVMDLLMNLQEQAPAAGGRVIVLMANHEAMNLVSEFRDVAGEAYAAFADEESEPRREEGRPPGFIEYAEALGPDGLYGRWLRTLPVAVQIDDIIFLHAGISPEHRSLGLEEINARVREETETFDRSKRHMVERGLVAPHATLREMVAAAQEELEMLATRARRPAGLTRDQQRHTQVLEEFLDFGDWFLLAPHGPLWFRGLAWWDDEEGDPLVTEILERYGARRLVAGHTPQPDGRITVRFGGKVFLIDTGMLSSHYGGRASALEIEGGRFTAIYPDGTEVLLNLRAEAPSRTGALFRRQLDARPQPSPASPRQQPQGAAMHACDAGGHRQPQAGAARLRAEVGPAHLLEDRLRDSRAVVDDLEHDHPAAGVRTHLDRAPGGGLRAVDDQLMEGLAEQVCVPFD